MSPTGLFLLALVALAFAAVPIAIAHSRRSTMVLPIAIVALFFGWTLLGWVAAFIWACVSPIKPLVRRRRINHWHKSR